MLAIIGVYLVALTVAIIVVIVRDAIHDRCPLFSTRNFFLFGLVNFQSVSGAVTCFTEQTEPAAYLPKPIIPAAVFAIILTIFTIALLVAYRKVNLVERLASRLSCRRFSSKTTLSSAGVIMVLIGVGLRFAASGVPWVGVLLPQMAAGCLCAGCGLIAMAWARSAFNPATAVLLLGALGASAAALLVDAFGRREILGLCFAVAWALYYEKWKAMRVPKLVVRLVIAMIATGIPFIVFSAARSSGLDKRSVAQQIQAMMEIDARAIEENVMGALSGQMAGGISMWIWETRPDPFPLYPLHSLFYFVTMPIPRDLWPDKPEGLGLVVVHQAAVPGVSSMHSWGPGLVGHLANDVVYIALPIYALLIALMLRYMDERMRRAASDPITVVLFGSALGQILGMPRGDLGLFAFHMCSAYAGVWIFFKLGVGTFFPKDRSDPELDGEVDEAFTEDYDPDQPGEFDVDAEPIDGGQAIR